MDNEFSDETNAGTQPEDSLLEKVICTAQENVHVSAVVLNGSRADPAVVGDCFQDYDIVYIVDGLDPFLNNPRWVDVFGERIIMQTPANMRLLPSERDGCFPYLMIFREGKRLDLTLVPRERAFQRLSRERHNVILWDRNGETKLLAASLRKKKKEMRQPSAGFFFDCCNEFWWVITYPAKGIWRQELPYAMKTFQYARDMLDQMLEWHIGLKSHFSQSGGKEGRFFAQCLSSDFWNLYTATYAEGNYESLWEALFAACRLFHLAAVEVAECMGIEYEGGQESNVLEYLRNVRRLPSDAVSLYGENET